MRISLHTRDYDEAQLRRDALAEALEIFFQAALRERSQEAFPMNGMDFNIDMYWEYLHGIGSDFRLMNRYTDESRQYGESRESP